MAPVFCDCWLSILVAQLAFERGPLFKERLEDMLNFLIPSTRQKTDKFRLANSEIPTTNNVCHNRQISTGHAS